MSFLGCVFLKSGTQPGSEDCYSKFSFLTVLLIPRYFVFCIRFSEIIVSCC